MVTCSAIEGPPRAYGKATRQKWIRWQPFMNPGEDTGGIVSTGGSEDGFGVFLCPLARCVLCHMRGLRRWHRCSLHDTTPSYPPHQCEAHVFWGDPSRPKSFARANCFDLPGPRTQDPVQGAAGAGTTYPSWPVNPSSQGRQPAHTVHSYCASRTRESTILHRRSYGLMDCPAYLDSTSGDDGIGDGLRMTSLHRLLSG